MASLKKSPIFDDKRSFLLVTGASKGLGRSLAINLASKLGKKSFVLLLARNKEGLEETKTQILKKCPDLDLAVAVRALDLSQCSDGLFDKLLTDVIRDADVEPASFQQLMIVHNAAQLGDVSRKASEFTDAVDFQEYWNINITSPAILNNVFLRHFPPSEKQGHLCINITSICALQPFKTWALYCTGNSFSSVFALILLRPVKGWQ